MPGKYIITFKIRNIFVLVWKWSIFLFGNFFRDFYQTPIKQAEMLKSHNINNCLSMSMEYYCWDI